ncbi:hypothetical protein TVAG_372930 [Trichomonas vaginalis G3]|uniref:Uncharacterized protein n=1 Tax=Trichomonas vaginalis (strain ATCC PRA-98 / G3) TaxID=412133 RepID=A2DZF6_TRIV3|nr:hypothetical protein TVAGG3_0041120 [Trichomonas vaginalis G3]EAY14160.1 hypothetical protein TVAG_372930 [Trichomonas vaginalis G3]KAI5540701.1 hypothetical protein TVAGG3_0041120 [Trichomonas vaginalis G3]|eukprot:XP_001326383.1 hypothetical protein [Trichomonas vaginalis G3]
MQPFPCDDLPRRNYIRRKRCLNESINIIEKTLLCLSSIRKDKIDKSELTKFAKAHANEVEAACWTPRMKMSDEDYQNLMTTKTKELCLVLIKKLMPTIDIPLKKSENASPASSPPENKFVVPIISTNQLKQASQPPKAPPIPNITIPKQLKPPSSTLVDPLADFYIPITGTTESYSYMPSFEPPPSLDECNLLSLDDFKDSLSFPSDFNFSCNMPYDV